MKSFFLKLWAFIRSKFFLINFSAIIGVIFLSFLFLSTWLKCYTSHGEKIKMPNFTNMTIVQAQKVANIQNLKLKVIDSVYLLGKLPGVILNQDPIEGEEVKKNRTVYLTATKEIADNILLPTLSGNDNYERYSRVLKRFAITTTIKKQIVHEKYQENTILHFFYKDKKIDEKDLIKGVKVPKGCELEFVTTKKTSSFVEMPDFTCSTLAQAKSTINNYRLILGRVKEKGQISNEEDAYIYKQNPNHFTGIMIQTGDTVHLYITQKQPSKCN